MRRLRVVTGLLSMCVACATPGLQGPSAANSSGNSNSGASSGNSGNSSGNSNSGASSGNSGNSSGQSGNSSQNSNNSSANSNQSSANSRGSSDSNASSRNSSNGTTEDPDVQRSSYIAAGSALLLTTAAAVGLIIFSVRRAATPPAPERLQDQAKPAQAWLKANYRQLQEDLALGAGPALDDLAAASEIRIEHRERFCRLLARNRQALLEPLQSAQISLEDTVKALSVVGTLTQSDDVLRADAEAYMARHPEPT